MFGFLKRDPAVRVRKAYHAKLEAAMQMQRNGKIREYSMLTAVAEALREQLEKIEAEQASA